MPVDADRSDATAAELFTVRAELAKAQREVARMQDALAAGQERERSLAYELQHRVRNLLAVIRSVYRRTRETGGSPNEFAEHFYGRLGAIARFHSRVGAASGPGTDLEDILRDELLQTHCSDGEAYTIAGPLIELPPKTAELMELVVHELITNSIKFGALAQDGTVAIDWSIEEAEGESWLRFRWSEAGVSLVTSAPRPSGFGRDLVEEALSFELGATTSFDLRPGGLECVIRLPFAGTGITLCETHSSAQGSSDLTSQGAGLTR
jgi:two-component system CheB/CheR fusion protein